MAAKLLYNSAKEWREAPQKRVLLLGMSGLGKTYISNVLRDSGQWYHYSVDYRIGTKYMGEHIADNAKREAMGVPFLKELLMSDSIYIASNITFDNLAPLSAYLGKPGDPSKGGLSIDEYRRRQKQHEAAEKAALLDTPYFIDRAMEIYGYPHFICDTSGSICEVVDPDDAQDPILNALRESTLMVWIEGSDDHTEELIKRFDRAPKPMCYQPAFLTACWEEYLSVSGENPDEVDPDAFVRWTYGKALAHRAPRYQSIAQNWGMKISADDLSGVRSEADIVDAIAGVFKN